MYDANSRKVGRRFVYLSTGYSNFEGEIKDVWKRSKRTGETFKN